MDEQKFLILLKLWLLFLMAWWRQTKKIFKIRNFRLKGSDNWMDASFFFRVTSFHSQLFSFRKDIRIVEKLSFSYSGDILILLWYCLTGWCHPKSRPSRTQWHSSCSPIAQDKTSLKIDHKCLENLPMNFVDTFFSFLVNWFSIYNRSD